MNKNKKLRKLKLQTETLTNVSGAGWHRTTLRCHDSYWQSNCHSYCDTQCNCPDTGFEQCY